MCSRPLAFKSVKAAIKLAQELSSGDELPDRFKQHVLARCDPSEIEEQIKEAGVVIEKLERLMCQRSKKYRETMEANRANLEPQLDADAVKHFFFGHVPGKILDRSFAHLPERVPPPAIAAHMGEVYKYTGATIGKAVKVPKGERGPRE